MSARDFSEFYQSGHGQPNDGNGDHDGEEEADDPDYVNEDEDEDEDIEDNDDEYDDEGDDAIGYNDGDHEDHGHGDGPFLQILVEAGAGGDSTLLVGRLLRASLTRRRVLQQLHGADGTQGVPLWVDNGGSFRWTSPRRPVKDPNRFPRVPSQEGRQLMESGLFGWVDRRSRGLPKALARRLLDRELGIGDSVDRKINQGLMLQGMIPSSNPEFIVHYSDPVCCGQFSDDGNFFYSCGKDFKVRMYDTSSLYNWKHYKTVTYPLGQWTLTDAALSPDNKWLAYTSLQSNVCFARTDPKDEGDPYTLNLASPLTVRGGWLLRGNFPIFSIRFSGDGQKLVAGTGAHSIVVYDIESRQVLHHIIGHTQDVNAVCFADKGSPHILYSGSDDCTIKVWDTRSIGDGREAGAFVGHVEGLTYIDSKNDGRYILSNSKDQSMKLWDLRMAMSTDRFHEVDPTQCTREQTHEYDYRWENYDDYYWFPHPYDNSVVTFRGHKVQRTLIRCHFSPPGSTDSRYVYSGSQDGNVYVWNMDATIAAKIDVKSVTKGKVFGDRRYRIHHPGITPDWTTLIRDVAWHPSAPILAASAWNGPAMNNGTVTVHSYNESDSDEGDPKMGISVDEKMVADPDIISHSLVDVP